MSDHLGAGKPSRTTCIYCGARLIAPPWIACTLHRDLPALDPKYAEPTVTQLQRPKCVACRALCGQDARKTPLGWICAACAYILDADE